MGKHGLPKKLPDHFSRLLIRRLVVIGALRVNLTGNSDQ